MGKSKIEWTDATWNPTVGCALVSPGCTNCYAMKQAARVEKMNPALAHYHGLTQPSKAGPVWTGKIGIAPEGTLLAPLRWKKPRRIFVNSMSDLFHEDVPDAVIDRVFAVMARAPQHIFQVLTKRAKRMRIYMTTSKVADPRDPAPSRAGDICCAAMSLNGELEQNGEYPFTDEQCFVQPDRWPLPNVWLGVSCEDQARADERIPDLLAMPAALRFVSAEPLLGAIDFTRIEIIPHRESRAGIHVNTLTGRSRESGLPYHFAWDGKGHASSGDAPRLDWIITGGESGPGARPMHPDWARSIRDQCAAEGVPLFMKQWGEWAPGECADAPPTRMEKTAEFFDRRWHFGTVSPKQSEGGHVDDEPDLYRLGKRRAGRTLDGIEHNAMPGNT